MNKFTAIHIKKFPNFTTTRGLLLTSGNVCVTFKNLPLDNIVDYEDTHSGTEMMFVFIVFTLLCFIPQGCDFWRFKIILSNELLFSLFSSFIDTVFMEPSSPKRYEISFGSIHIVNSFGRDKSDIFIPHSRAAFTTSGSMMWFIRIHL